MKRILPAMLAGLMMMVILTGCSSRSGDEPHAGWSGDWLRVHRDLAVEHPAGFRLDETSSAVMGDGMFYATWVTGEGRNVTGAQGAAATAYDAQIYFLAKGNATAEKAESELTGWIGREQTFYETDGEPDFTAAGQTFRILTLRKALRENPYSRGAAAFAVHGTDTISVELLCAEDWDGDAQAVLRAFLGGIHYGD